MLQICYSKPVKTWFCQEVLFIFSKFLTNRDNVEVKYIAQELDLGFSVRIRSTGRVRYLSCSGRFVWVDGLSG